MGVGDYLLRMLGLRKLISEFMETQLIGNFNQGRYQLKLRSTPLNFSEEAT